jgi:tetratricopeptide (TPR) repeat protein
MVPTRNEVKVVFVEPSGSRPRLMVHSLTARPLGPPPPPSTVRYQAPPLAHDLKDVLDESGAAFGRGDYARAVELCEIVLGELPDFVPALARKGESLHRLRLFDKALTALVRGLALSPGDYWMWHDLATTMGGWKRWEEGRRLMLHALKLAPDDYWGWHDLAWMEAAAGDSRGAVGHFDLASLKNPRGVEALADKADLLAARGDTRAARALWERVQTIAPQHAKAKAELARLSPPRR